MLLKLLKNDHVNLTAGVFPPTRVRTLERKLEAKMIKEESDYHDLESVVQQVEQNLELMTVRKASACGIGRKLQRRRPSWT